MVDGEGQLGHAGDGERAKAVENHHKWIDAAAALGCHSIRVNAAGGGEREEVARRAAESLVKLADYAEPYLTMRPEYEAATLEVFARLVEQGIVYRALRPVHWSIANQTALADAELALCDAVVGGSKKFFLGTDSAPHEKQTKETACGCAGCYSSHAAIELYAEVFEDLGVLDRPVRADDPLGLLLGEAERLRVEAEHRPDVLQVQVRGDAGHAVGRVADHGFLLTGR